MKNPNPIIINMTTPHRWSIPLALFPFLPSSTTGSDELSTTSQSINNIAHGSPNMSSTGAVSSLSTTNPPSASSIPILSPSYSPQPQFQSSNPSPHTPSSALVTVNSVSSDNSSPYYNSPISTVSIHPSSVKSPEMGTSLCTYMGTDSIPFH